ncbi:MAG: hypothetical protein JXK07_08665 [Spirochaetes bacterium]|nr:hypothetical protein [Spirochaetota bacterium]MBN2771976.1 hypothetical protein [Spirochaetota bacterium]
MKLKIKINAKTFLTVCLVFCLAFVSCTATRSSFKQVKHESDILKIIYYGTLAGNSHNTQPWKVKIIDDKTIEIYADFSRKLEVVDETSRGLYISLGAFIENCVLSAGALGYHADVKYSSEFSGDHMAASITVKKADHTDFDLADISARATLRTPFKTEPVSKSDLSFLIGSDQESVLFIKADSENGKYISQQNLLAYTQQSRDTRAKEELAGWIRFANSDVKKHRDGLTTAGMGIKGFSALFVRNFFSPEDSKSDSFVEAGIKKAEVQLSNQAGWIVIKQPGSTPTDWMEAGRVYQRVHLKCRSCMIGFHPFNAVLEENNYEREFNKKIRINGTVHLLARIGYVDSYPKPVSVRRTVEDILVSD